MVTFVSMTRRISWKVRFSRLSASVYLFELEVFKTHMSDENEIWKCLNFQIVFKSMGKISCVEYWWYHMKLHEKILQKYLTKISYIEMCEIYLGVKLLELVNVLRFPPGHTFTLPTPYGGNPLFIFRLFHRELVRLLVKYLWLVWTGVPANKWDYLGLLQGYETLVWRHCKVYIYANKSINGIVLIIFDMNISSSEPRNEQSVLCILGNHIWNNGYNFKMINPR